MLFTNILTALFVTAAVAAPVVVPRADDTLDTFTLVAAGQSGPAEWLPTVPADGNQDVGGPLGWWKNQKGTDLTAFVQFEKKSGIVFDSKNTVRSIYLRKDGRVFLGSGVSEEGKGSVENAWTVTKASYGNKEYFGVKGDTKGFVLCDGPSGKSLFYKPTGKKCSKVNIEVAYTN